MAFGLMIKKWENLSRPLTIMLKNVNWLIVEFVNQPMIVSMNAFLQEITRCIHNNNKETLCSHRKM
jgi:hypothetical protein